MGAITVRLERLSNGKARLYLVTLGVLAAYRDSGIGRHRSAASFHKDLITISAFCIESSYGSIWSAA